MTGLFSIRCFQQSLCISCVIFCFLQLCVVENLYAQDYSWVEFVEKISTDEDFENENLEILLEVLSELHEHPFNLNTATKEDLEQLIFLNENDVEAILAYIYRYGPMQSLGELKLVTSLDYKVIRFLPLFVYVAPVTMNNKEDFRLKNLWKNGNNRLITQFNIPLYQRNGYRKYPDEILLKNPNKVYLGNALYHSLRYQYQYKQRVYWGFTAEKDAGEPFGHYGNWSYDAFSFHLLLKDCGKLKTLVLGDYRLNFGEGLVVNTNFALGKLAVLNKQGSASPVNKFSSVTETDFFRGVAATFRWRDFDLSAFYSYLPQDATLNDDETLSSLKTDGLHRTLLELSKKHNVKGQTAGANVTWNTRWITWGVTGVYQHFNRAFSPGTTLYRRYYPKGNRFVNLSTNYRLRYRHLLFSGETAYSHVYHGWATLNKMIYRWNNDYQITVLQRLYTYQYVALHAKAFSEGGTVKNESGWYVGGEMNPRNELKLGAYVDYFYFPWPKLGITHSSHGVDATGYADWAPHKQWNVSCRYQFKRKERYEEPYTYHKLKGQIIYLPWEKGNFVFTGRYTRVVDRYGRRADGYLCGSTLNCKMNKERMRLSLSGAYFDSKDHKAPMSFYEPGLLYAFSFLSFYGQGMRLALNFRWDIHKNWTVIGKYGRTHYFDRPHIGLGTQRIEGNRQNDLYFQLRCKF